MDVIILLTVVDFHCLFIKVFEPCKCSFMSEIEFPRLPEKLQLKY